MKGHEVLIMELKPLFQFLLKNSITENQVDQIQKKLDSISFFTSLILKSKVSGFQRVTINKRLFNGKNIRIEDISFLRNPPERIVSRYGRANLPKQSVLYATFDPLTALSEMRPEVGDLVTTSTWKLKMDYDLCYSPVFKNSTRDGIIHNEMALRSSMQYRNVLRKYDEEMAKQIDVLVKFMADCFAKDVDPSSHLDYFMSAYFANKIFYHFENGEVDAILYPSVRQSLTLTNIALKPEVFEQNYQIDLVEEGIVTGVPAQIGGWTFKGTGYCKKFDGTKILWK
jgi:hypothetical protein